MFGDAQMKNKISALFLFLLIILSSKSFAGIYFNNLNINDDNVILYNVVKRIPGAAEYSTLYSTKINLQNKCESPKLLTCYPEKIKLLSNGKKLWISNIYGNSIYDFSTHKLNKITEISSIEKNNIENSSCMSPDGKWIVFLAKEKSSKVQLVLQNNETRKYVILNNDAPINENKVPVKWSSDSQNFIYQKANDLFFCNPESMFNGFWVDEKYRRVGSGSINCIEWMSKESFVFIDSDIIYLINSKEFISLGIYSNIFSIGTIIGRLPDSFDKNNSKFSINSAGTKLLLVKNNNLFYYYDLSNGTKLNYVEQLNSKNSIKGFYESYNTNVAWKNDEVPLIFIHNISDNAEKISSVYSFNNENELVKVLSLKNASTDFTISNNGKYIAIAIDSTVYIYSTEQWNYVDKIIGDKIASLIWVNDSNLCIGGSEVVRLYDVASKKQTVLFLSSSSFATWDKNTGKIITYNKTFDKVFSYNEKLNTWKILDSSNPQDKKVQNNFYRLYTASSKNANFENGIFVRNLFGKVATFSLYNEVMNKNHAQKKIALVFDLTDNAFGINEIIALSKKYNLEFTYFINGEFIRRYPIETKKIAKTNCEIGSLFYTNLNLLNDEYKITSEYVKKGLARNEDEFFSCTGKELSLIWHAPFYKSNELIRNAGGEAGYKYIDFPTEMDSFNTKAGKTMENQIIPISVGLSSRNNSQLFYEKLELLINTLLDANYKIVPVSEL